MDVGIGVEGLGSEDEFSLSGTFSGVGFKVSVLGFTWVFWVVKNKTNKKEKNLSPNGGTMGNPYGSFRKRRILF